MDLACTATRHPPAGRVAMHLNACSLEGRPLPVDSPPSRFFRRSSPACPQINHRHADTGMLDAPCRSDRTRPAEPDKRGAGWLLWLHPLPGALARWLPDLWLVGCCGSGLHHLLASRCQGCRDAVACLGSGGLLPQVDVNQPCRPKRSWARCSAWPLGTAPHLARLPVSGTGSVAGLGCVWS